MSTFVLTFALAVLIVAAAEVCRLRAAIYDAREAILNGADVCLCGEPARHGPHNHIIVTGTDVAFDVLTEAVTSQRRAQRAKGNR
jgi:hypothetical protein